AQLTAFLDARERWEKDERRVIHDAMLALSVAAEMTGNVEESAEIDRLRQRAEETVLPSSGIRTYDEIIAALRRRRAQAREHQQLAASYAEQDEVELVLLVNSGKPLQREAALDALVKRRSPTAVAALVETVLSNPEKRWLDDLGSLPQDPVRRYLAIRIE